MKLSFRKFFAIFGLILLCCRFPPTGALFLQTQIQIATPESGNTITELLTPYELEEQPIYNPNHTIIPITMYYQIDPTWGTYLYGGRDPISSHGCGPTCLAIAVSSLTETVLTPIESANWSVQNRYYSRGRGTVHAFIPHGAEAYGLTSESLNSLTFESAKTVIDQGKIIIALVGAGDFTDGGHFIVIHGYTDYGDLIVADPASAERSAMSWSAERISSQLSTYAQSGGPLWVLSN